MDGKNLLRKLTLIRDMSAGLNQLTDDIILDLEDAAGASEPDESHCPNCGSPKLSDVSCMGKPEFKCNDCGEVAIGEISE